MRILECTLDYAPRPTGGAEHQARLQAETLARRGHEVHVVCPRQGREGSGRVGQVAVHRLWRINHRPFQTATAALSLGCFLLLRGCRYDLVHVHIADSRAHVAAFFSRLHRRPLYIKVAGGGPRGDIGKMRRFSWLTRYYGLRRAACIQAISAEIAAQATALGIAPAKVAAIPNGFDPAVFRPASDSERAELRRQLGLPLDRPIVLYVGRIAGHKGIPSLVRIWPAIRDRFQAECVVVGYRALEDPYDVPADSPGLTCRDWTEDPSQYYRAADVFVHPSISEGMPNSILEAMACGLPVVATNVGGVPEIILDKSLGSLVPAGDDRALEDALADLLSDDRRREIGQRAAVSVAARFSLDTVVEMIEARYEAITSS